MRKLILLIILALSALGVAYKLGYLDKMIVRYIYHEQLSKSNISTAPANTVITTHDATIQNVSADATTTILTVTLKNSSNKTHELVQIETEISNEVKFFETFHKNEVITLQEVYGMPIEGFSIVTLTPKKHFAKIINLQEQPKKGDSVSIRLIFSDNTEKNILATVK
jgi:copper(I)-binding protein